MQYRINPKNNDKISSLSHGCMRFPKSGSKIDQEKTTALVKLSIESGINYFDTAYLYPGNEEALGTALHELGLRKEVKIATKIPHYFCKTHDDLDKFFAKQLERLKTDYIDYYLIHMLNDVSSWDRIKLLGAADWIKEKKASGQIKNIGFSYHGGREAFKVLIDSYDWDFCMIQYNYLDEFNQAGRAGLEYAAAKKLPVFIMEPLRGGYLANGLPEKATEIFKKSNPDFSPAQWALRWLYNQSGVTSVLSGMNETAQIKENSLLADISPAGCLDNQELDVYGEVLKTINSKIKVPCTGCGYCLPCPFGVDIPNCFHCYNESYSRGYISGMKAYFMNSGAMTPTQTYASKCRKCKKCEKHCPQKIEISKELRSVAFRLEPVMFKTLAKIVRRFMNAK